MGGEALAALTEAIDALDLQPLGQEIEKALWLRDRLDAKISKALRRFDADEAWRADGSLSLTSWLAAHGRRSRRDSFHEALVARRLAELEVTAKAWAEGKLSSGQVAAIVANVSAERAGLYAEHEEEMTPLLAELSVADVASAMRSWRLHAEALEDHPDSQEPPSELHLSQVLRRAAGGLSAPRPSTPRWLRRPLPWPTRACRGGGGPLPSTAQRRAEALVEVCRWFLTHFDKAATGSRERPQVSVIVSLDDLANDGPGRLADGTAVSASTTLRLACDAVLHRIVMTGRSTILDYGSATRTISPALWAALVVRDWHCRHPGCDRRPSWCEAHHVVHFSKGGPTRLSNLVLACSRHHHLWHDKGWELELSPDGTLVLRSPSGVVLTSRPPPARLVA